MAAIKQQERKRSGLLYRYVPILHWLPHYKKTWLSGDIVAGLSVWALIESCDMLNKISENMKSIGVEIHLARVKHEVMEMLKNVGVDQFIRHDHNHNKVFEAVQLFTQKKKPGAKNDQ